MKLPVYLDYAATTPVNAEVARMVSACLTSPCLIGNPASTHFYGAKAAMVEQTARAKVAAILGADAEQIIWTSCATEANNMAIWGVAAKHSSQGGHIITCATEHQSVLQPCFAKQRDGFELTVLSPDQDGQITPEQLAQALRPDTILVTIMAVNNETGVIQDLASLGQVVADSGALFHVDATQGVGRIAIDADAWQADFIALSAHKMFGPKGIGCLYMRQQMPASIKPMILGGGQQQGMRSGTLPLPLIAGFGQAADLANQLLSQQTINYIWHLRQLFLHEVGAHVVHGDNAPKVPHIINLALLHATDMDALQACCPDVAFARGSACSTASKKMSHVLTAMAISPKQIAKSIRISLSHELSADEVQYAARQIAAGIDTLNKLAGVSKSAPGISDATNIDFIRKLKYAGMMAQPKGQLIQAQAGSIDSGRRVNLQLDVVAGIVQNAGYQVYGCDQTILLIEQFAGSLVGLNVIELADLKVKDLVTIDDLPDAKRGVLLLLQQLGRQLAQAS